MVKDGRVCATPEYKISISPISDNLNIGVRDLSGQDTYSVFPGTGVKIDTLQGTCRAGYGH